MQCDASYVHFADSIPIEQFGGLVSNITSHGSEQSPDVFVRCQGSHVDCYHGSVREKAHGLLLLLRWMVIKIRIPVHIIEHMQTLVQCILTVGVKVMTDDR